MSHRLLAHTADLRAAVEGADLPALYQAAADLVRELVVGESAVEPREERRVELPALGDAERFFRFVRELVYLYDAEAFVPARALYGDPALVEGEPFDPARHVSLRQLKAVTRHGYRFAAGPGGCRAELVFDL